MFIYPLKETKIEALEVKENSLKSIMDQGDFVLALVTATKPDFYKQASLIPASDKIGMPLFVMNTGQHYDDLLGHGLKEFQLDQRMGVDMKIRGDLSQKSAELMLKMKKFSEYLKKHYPEKTVLPIVHGDTHAAGVVPLAWMFATNQKCAQNEAGLRSMSPDYKNYKVIPDFINNQFNEDYWSLNRNEPFPEQYNTFIGGAACHFFFAAHELNKKHLIKEGYTEKNIPVVGNSIVDAIEWKRKEKAEESVFDLYPKLETGDWIRVDIHRRGNLLPSRFKAIMAGIKKLVDSGYKVNLIGMNAFLHAVKENNLEEELEKLKGKKNFLYTGLWPKYAHVIEFLESGKCFAEFTDSGSMQEELNEIEETLCLTCRFNTDRPETVFEAKSNLLIPPISGQFIYDFVDLVYKEDDLREKMNNGKKLYGEQVADKILKFLKEKQEHPFTWAHEAVGFEEKNRKQTFL